MESLPQDVIIHLFSFLDYNSLLCMRVVNKNLSKLASDDTVWESRCVCKGEKRICDDFFKQKKYELYCNACFERHVLRVGSGHRYDVFNAEYVKDLTDYYTNTLKNMATLKRKIEIFFENNPDKIRKT